MEHVVFFWCIENFVWNSLLNLAWSFKLFEGVEGEEKGVVVLLKWPLKKEKGSRQENLNDFLRYIKRNLLIVVL